MLQSRAFNTLWTHSAGFQWRALSTTRLKRPASGYILFCKDKRPELKKENPDSSFGELSRLLGHSWKEASDAEKQPYFAVAEEAMARHKAEQQKLGKQAEKEAKPKRAVSAYNFFLKGERARIKEANPKSSFVELAQLVGQAWREASEEEKAPYVDLAMQDKGRSEDDRQRLSLVKVKRPSTAYIFFSKAERARIQEANPDASFGEIGKLIGQAWREASAEGKAPYIDQALKDTARYEAEREAPIPKARSVSAYNFFLKLERANIRKANPDANFAEIAALVGEAWQNLDDEGKAPYIDQAMKDKDRFLQLKANQKADQL